MSKRSKRLAGSARTQKRAKAMGGRKVHPTSASKDLPSADRARADEKVINDELRQANKLMQEVDLAVPKSKVSREKKLSEKQTREIKKKLRAARFSINLASRACTRIGADRTKIDNAKRRLEGLNKFLNLISSPASRTSKASGKKQKVSGSKGRSARSKKKKGKAKQELSSKEKKAKARAALFERTGGSPREQRRVRDSRKRQEYFENEMDSGPHFDVTGRTGLGRQCEGVTQKGTQCLHSATHYIHKKWYCKTHEKQH